MFLNVCYFSNFSYKNKSYYISSIFLNKFTATNLQQYLYLTKIIVLAICFASEFLLLRILKKFKNNNVRE